VEIVKQKAGFTDLKDSRSGVIKVLDWKLVGRQGASVGYPVYKLTFWRNGCIPQPYKALMAFLSENGLDSFIFFRSTAISSTAPIDALQIAD
jgi:hypothetical protein